MKPTALSLVDAAHILTKVGDEKATAEMLQRDLEAGAPTNSDGTINLVHFAAWMLREMRR